MAENSTPTAAVAPQSALPENPYVGPRPFEESQRSNFFGRNEEIRQLSALVIAHRVVLLHAISGAGKTSLLQAGLIPQLKERKRVATLPIARVSGELRSTDNEPAQNIYSYNLLVKLWLDRPDRPNLSNLSLMQGLEPLISSGADERQPRAWLLIIDQFEELFTTNLERYTEREEFFRQLQELLATFPQLSLLLSMREDYIAQLDNYAGQLPDRIRTRFRLERLTSAAALSAIQQPAQQAKRPFATGVAESLVDNLRRSQNVQMTLAGSSTLRRSEFVEPVHLQIVCRQLWERLPADRTEILAEDVQQFGDVDQALRDFYEDALSAASEQTAVSTRQLRQWIDEHLITPARTRGLVYYDEQSGTTEGLPNAVIDLLNSRYVVRAEIRGGEAWYELAHDRLLEPIINANAAWFAQNQHPLNQAAAAWNTAGRPPNLLLSGGLLTEARRQLEAEPDAFDEVTHEFVVASKALSDQREARRRRLLIGVISGVCLVLLVVTGWALRNETRARQAQATAEAAASEAHTAQSHAESAATDVVKAQMITIVERDEKARQSQIAGLQRLAAQSLLDVSINPQLNNLLIAETIQSGQQLNALSQTVGLQQYYNGLSLLGGIPLYTHYGQVQDVQFSPNGQWLATGDDGGASLWNVQHPLTPPVQLAGVSTQVTQLAFSPDGTWLAGGGADAKVYLWQLTPQPRLIQTLAYEGTLYELVFSPQGHWLAAATGLAYAQLWAMQSITQTTTPQNLPHQYPDVRRVIFSADEQKIVTVSGSDILLWQASDHFAMPTTLVSGPWNVDFSANGRWLVFSTEASMEVYNLDAAEEKRAGHLPANNYAYAFMQFSPDSRMISNGNQLWQLNQSGAWSDPITLTNRPPDGTGSPLFSHDSRWLVTRGSDYALYRWDTQDISKAPYVYRGHEGEIRAVDFSPDDRMIASVSADGSIRLWQISSPMVMPIILHNDDSVNNVQLWDNRTADPSQTRRSLAAIPAALPLLAMTPNGKYIAFTDEANSNTITLLQPADPLAKPIQLAANGSIQAMALSPDGHWLAAGTWSGLALVWDLTAPSFADSTPLELQYDSAVRTLAFSGDGSLLVTGTGDTGGQELSVRVWKLSATERPQLLHQLNGHSNIVRSVAVSRSGRWVLSGSWDYTARLWDLQQTVPASTVRSWRFGARLFATGFSPDEKWAAAGSWDSTVKLINLQHPDDEPLNLAQHRGRILDLAFSPDNHWLATAGEDQRVVLWDLTAVNPATAFVVIRSPKGSGSGVKVNFSPDSRWLAAYGASAFSADGAWLVTASNDVQLWNLRLDELADATCLAAGRNLTDDEWQRYFPSEAYRAICPAQTENPLARRLQAQELLLDGDRLAATGEITPALALYQQANSLDPLLAISTTELANQRAIISLLQHGKALAQSGAITSAIPLWAVARQVDPSVSDNVRTFTATLRVDELLEEAAQLKASADYTQTAVRYLEAISLTSESPVSAKDLNDLCWQGALHHAAAAVLAVCDKAVVLAPEDGGIRDSRGVARAQTGDLAGAQADFEFFVEWSEQTGAFAAEADVRRNWIEALQAGKNPIDEATLETLRGE
ncbi:MAG: MerR family transcriptional regulator [Caldilineaceae bacterium]